MTQLVYSAKNVAKPLRPMLELIGEHFPLKSGSSNISLDFAEVAHPGAYYKVSKVANAFKIEYSTTSAAARGLGSVLSGVVDSGETSLKRLGIMLDCSRNKVFTVEHLKEWIRQLALLGYNMIMLYTEDTYKMPDEPYFGYMRGGYTMDELQDLDAYASKLGIELIGCIQTLGHLEQVLRWTHYDSIKDTESVLNVGKPEAYELIEKMLKFWGKAFKSRRIHIGMDETHDLGRGKFLDQNGFVEPITLFNQHFAKVRDLAQKQGLEVEIWSDMYFRLSNERQEYYMADLKIKKSVKDMIPEGVRLWYWDYYHDDPELVDKMLIRHEELDRPVGMASGIWTWTKMWCNSVQNRKIFPVHIEACRKHKTEDLLFTMWGDDGHYCMMDSAWACLALASDLAFGCENDKNTAKRTAVIARRDYAIDMKIGEAEHGFMSDDNKWLCGSITPALWDNPLLALWQRGYEKAGLNSIERLTGIWRDLIKVAKKAKNYNDQLDLQVMVLVMELALNKIKLRQKIKQAYVAGDKKALKKLALKEIPAIIDQFELFNVMYRAQWFKEAKACGLDLMQVRNGGCIGVLKEAQLRLLEYVKGVISTVEELENEPEIKDGYCVYSYKGVATAYLTRW